MRFSGRRAVVTGGLSGIGEAVAKRIAAEGGKVAIWDVNGGIKCDISDLASVEAAMAETLKQLGGVDILVNSAGITGPTVPVDGFPVDGWMKTIAINLNGTFHTNRTVLPHMIAQNYGRIVNIASIAGKEGNPNASAYSASKAGVIAFTKSLSKEVAKHDITANSVTPAAVRTPIFDQMPQSHIDFMLSRIPKGRFGTVQENAAVICFLASEECSFSTGAVFDTSGGRATY
ncbi:SDR family oxidoreductase [Aestuariivirga litoralis]|uniref:SDR family oxidoreductase n=1 Tax=Aestuariivirga litoralis TaxID=2650924 RepID=UPI0018C679FC|nr:SDR family NAD(P)-dependent oxidoreductase [Aestuariivirga litoralis]MBG1233889.1 SDR family oxidoreductase [Aestuariivirga litoralis]